MSEKVFISWNDKNKKIAIDLSQKLFECGYSPIVGGNSDRTNYVGETIINHMRECEMAIMILERIDIGDCSKFSENVMFEWGYLSAYLNDPKKVFLFLIDTPTYGLPSDVLGSWVTVLKRDTTIPQEESDIKIASSIKNDFLSQIEQIKSTENKLKYLAYWNINKNNLINVNANFSPVLLYSIQAPIYFDETKEWYDTLNRIDNKLDSSQKSILFLVKTILSVFIKTERLTKSLSSESYHDIIEDLEYPFEDEQTDSDLKAWCEIFRKDKIELCYELYARTSINTKKVLQNAFKQGKEVIELINKQIERNPNDIDFGSFYISLASRNLAETCQSLLEFTEDVSEKEKLLAEEKEYRQLTEELRKKLRFTYKKEFGKDYIYECLDEEYILSRIENLKYEIDRSVKEEIIEGVDAQISFWEKQNRRRNMVKNKILSKKEIFESQG